ncbi:MAG: winged helix-turn-helix domain-containing protein [Xanthobacteraceae bacterium]
MSGNYTDPPPRSYAFGPFVLIPERQLLLRDEKPVRLGNRALDMLTVLVERQGEVVTKRQLMARVWPDLFVDEGNLKVNMVALRRALGEDPQSPYIATVVGRGYRFVAPVRRSDAETDAIEGAAKSPNHNLPHPTVRLVGRAGTIKVLQADLEQTRLVSIVGPGGMGKTTVAIAAVEPSVASFHDGTWLVELASLKDPTLVANAIATSIGLTAHSANMLAALCAYLRCRQMLIVLDSCEHLIEPVAAAVSRILAEAEDVKILTTSREPLGVIGERVRRLPGLETPPSASHLRAAEALAFPAVQLFVDRARDRLEGFELSDADAPKAAEICRRLDGLALAIELAATRIDAFGVAGLLQQLDDRFRLLEGPRGGAERHRTLTATIDWSYNLLAANEQTLLRRLAIFAGVFPLKAAHFIATDAHTETARIADDLAKLVSKSLVTAEPRDRGVEYRLLDTTRSYGLAKMVEQGELEAIRLRHARYCLEIAAEATSATEWATRDAWLACNTGKIDDIRDAVRWIFSDMAHAAIGIELTIAAIALWKRLSLVDECRAAVERVLDERFAALRSQRDDLILNLTLGATLLHVRGPVPQVKACLTRAHEIAEALGDADAQVECLRGLSEFDLWAGNTRAALSGSKKAQVVAIREQIAAGQHVDAQAGSALSYMGDLTASQRQLEGIVSQRLPLDWRGRANRFEFDQRLAARGTLASVLWLNGFPDQAVEMARRQLREAEDSYYAVSLCHAILLGSAVVGIYVRDIEGVDRFLTRGLQHATEHGLSVWRAMTTCLRGRWQLEAKKPFDIASYQQALAELHDGGFRLRYNNYLTNFAEGLAQHGDFEGGHAYVDQAMAVSFDTGQIIGIPEMLRIKGDIYRAEGARESPQAGDCYRQSMEWALKLNSPGWQLRTAISLVEHGRESGLDAHAEDALLQAYARFTEGFDTGDLRRARALLDTRDRAGQARA